MDGVFVVTAAYVVWMTAIISLDDPRIRRRPILTGAIMIAAIFLFGVVLGALLSSIAELQ